VSAGEARQVDGLGRVEEFVGRARGGEGVARRGGMDTVEVDEEEHPGERTGRRYTDLKVTRRDS
jgi:hypothetical protein